MWTADQVSQALGVAGPPGLRFSGISTDTRALRGGELFVALRGERFDAHEFLGEAKSRGAAAAVVHRGTAPVDGLPLYQVDDTLVALGRLGHARRRALPAGAPVVAVTGSSGKTSTKELIAAVLGARYRVHATAANLNNRVGVPLTILGAPAEADALVVEAGASVPGEIAALRDIIEPTIAVVTNVGHAHLEGFGSIDAVLREKLALVPGAAVAIVGIDPPALAAGARALAPTVVAGLEPPAEVRPDAVSLDEQGRPRISWRGAAITLGVAGMHQAENAMIALAVGETAGVAPAQAVAALAGARLPGGRGRVVRVGGLTVVDDTYNANPASLRRAVALARWLAEHERRPLAIVVGTMLELGPESGKLHAAAAEEILAADPVLIGAVGEFAAAFGPHRARLGDRLLAAPDVDALGPRLKAALRGDEVVLLKASRGVALERVLASLT